MQGETWVDRAHGVDHSGSMLGHGDVLNADVITAVEAVQFLASTEQSDAQLIAQMQEAHVHPNWQAVSVSCGMDHSAAVLSMPEDFLARSGMLQT